MFMDYEFLVSHSRTSGTVCIVTAEDIDMYISTYRDGDSKSQDTDFLDNLICKADRGTRVQINGKNERIKGQPKVVLVLGMLGTPLLKNSNAATRAEHPIVPFLQYVSSTTTKPSMRDDSSSRDDRPLTPDGDYYCDDVVARNAGGCSV